VVRKRRTRAVEKWFKPKGTLSGWSKDQSAATRHRHLLEAMRKRARGRTPGHKAALSVFRALLALANVTRDEETARVARADARWIKTTKAWKRL